MKIKRKRQPIEFDQDDFVFLDAVLRINPELRICALALKKISQAGLSFPLDSNAEFLKMLPKGGLSVEGHDIDLDSIEQYMRQELFPIATEKEFVIKVYGSLLHCREDQAWAARAPSNYKSLLEKQNELFAAAEVK
jgi:hypothetical protein